MLVPDLTNLTRNQNNLQTRVDRVQKMLSKLSSLRKTNNSYPEYQNKYTANFNAPVYYKKLKKQSTLSLPTIPEDRALDFRVKSRRKIFDLLYHELPQYSDEFEFLELEFKKQDEIIEVLCAQLDHSRYQNERCSDSENEYRDDRYCKFNNNFNEYASDGNFNLHHNNFQNSVASMHFDYSNENQMREYEHLKINVNEPLHEPLSSRNNSSERLNYVFSEQLLDSMPKRSNSSYIMSNEYSNATLYGSNNSSGYLKQNDRSSLNGSKYSSVEFLEHEGTKNYKHEPNYSIHINELDDNLYYTDKSDVKSSIDNELPPIKCKIQNTAISNQIHRTHVVSELFSIGQNDDGQLGILNSVKGYPYSSKFKKTLINDSILSSSRIQVRKICCGSVFTFVLTTCDRLYAWGLSDILGDEINDYEPREIHLGLSILDVACTEYAVCLIDAQNRLWTFGSFRNKAGKLHMNGKVDMIKRPQLLEFENAIRVSGGESHFACLDRYGIVYTWGIGESGQLFRKIDFTSVPIKISPQFDCKNVFCMGFSTFIITTDGIYCCGNNGYGELGLGDWEVRTEPTKMKAFEGVDIIQIVGGLHHVLFLDSMGVVWGTGRNDDGQLGLKKEVDFINYPMKVPFDEKISKIACGTSSFHSYAVDFNGNLYTCGQNQYEQLGYDSLSSCFGFKKVDTKGRRCELVHGGCQYTIVALTNKLE